MTKKEKLPDITWIEWMRGAVSDLGNNWCGGPSREHHDQAAKALGEAEAAWSAVSSQVPGKHLWEYDHPYIGPEGENAENHESWADFLESAEGMDPDYNLLFRWDWVKRGDDWQDDHFEGEPEPPETCLHLFYVRQRRGTVGSETVVVTPQDEPAVRAWLAVRVAYLFRVNEGV